jgi:hypothetical protein
MKLVIMPRANGAGWALYDTATQTMTMHETRRAAQRAAAVAATTTGAEIVDQFAAFDDAATLAAHAAAVAQPVRRRS